MKIPMDEGTFQQPTGEQLAAFRAGDPVVIDEVVQLVLPQLQRWALRRYSDLPEAEVQSLTHQVLAETCVRHANYDPTRAKITTYVINILSRRMADLYTTQRRITNLEDSSLEAHEKLLQQPYNQEDASTIATRMTREEFFRSAEQQLDAREQSLLSLLRQGENRIETLSEALAEHGPVTDPARDVKNARERLLRKLKAIAHQLGYQAHDLLDDGA
jgi:DNA-directed RNA polymerase specialized sigma24 family protein